MYFHHDSIGPGRHSRARYRADEFPLARAVTRVNYHWQVTQPFHSGDRVNIQSKARISLKGPYTSFTQDDLMIPA